ncbi:MAG: iron-containing alcohol dehydrogenase [Chromatiales bacterium]|jgi:alcohol dehydrogenase class IV|nr:iron-containing alcohol dehydrogenase [Chromatiales bacterium]
MDFRTFRAVSYPLRLHAGADALNQLPIEVDRVRSARAFVICGRSVATKTNLLSRIEDLLGARYAGAFCAMDKDSSWPAVSAAIEAARGAEADMLIAVGGGSVIVGARVVAIGLGEGGNLFDLMTQYPAGKPAFSPRLLAPKPPIINVVTTPTSAMNRAGSGLKNDDLDHRMEFFDPKTRPAALFWDADALLSAPSELIRSTATTTYTGALRVLGSEMNPLVEADRRQAFRLVQDALPRIMAEPANPTLRIDLCAAAFLENRAADDDQGRRRARDTASAHAYALATALHIRYDHVWQGESTSMVMPTVTRLTAPDDLEDARRIADTLGIWREGMTGDDANEAIADALEATYLDVGMPTRLRDMDIPREGLPLLAGDTLKNFNANPGGRSEDHVEQMLALLEAAW